MSWCPADLQSQKSSFCLGSPVVGMCKGDMLDEISGWLWSTFTQKCKLFTIYKISATEVTEEKFYWLCWLRCVTSYSHLGFLHFCLTASAETQLTSTSLFSGSSMEMFRHDMVHKDFQPHYTKKNKGIVDILSHDIILHLNESNCNFKLVYVAL